MLVICSRLAGRSITWRLSPWGLERWRCPQSSYLHDDARDVEEESFNSILSLRDPDNVVYLIDDDRSMRRIFTRC
jgi:hypothetical protein